MAGPGRARLDIRLTTSVNYYRYRETIWTVTLAALADPDPRRVDRPAPRGPALGRATWPPTPRMSPPAMSRHLRVLRGSGLVEVDTDAGRRPSPALPAAARSARRPSRPGSTRSSRSGPSSSAPSRPTPDDGRPMSEAVSGTERRSVRWPPRSSSNRRGPSRCSPPRPRAWFRPVPGGGAWPPLAALRARGPGVGCSRSGPTATSGRSGTCSPGRRRPGWSSPSTLDPTSVAGAAPTSPPRSRSASMRWPAAPASRSSTGAGTRSSSPPATRRSTTTSTAGRALLASFETQALERQLLELSLGVPRRRVGRRRRLPRRAHGRRRGARVRRSPLPARTRSCAPSAAILPIGTCASATRRSSASATDSRHPHLPRQRSPRRPARAVRQLREHRPSSGRRRLAAGLPAGHPCCRPMPVDHEGEQP